MEFHILRCNIITRMRFRDRNSDRCSVNTGDRTRAFNIISVLQITWLLLRDAIISSKIDLRSGSKKEKRSYGKVRNDKTKSTILWFIWNLYLKQQSNIVRCFCSLRFEKSLFSNKFFSFTFPSKMIVRTAKRTK